MELNEAFAVQLYCRDPGIQTIASTSRRLDSLGHPFGRTGSRMVGTLARMVRRQLRYGVVTRVSAADRGCGAL